MKDLNYFIATASNSTQREFRLYFADVIEVYETNKTTITTECGRTLIIKWDKLGLFKDYEVVYETPLMKGHPGMVEEIVAMLKHIQVDGETMQYILKRVRMQDQMLRQLMMTQPLDEINYTYEERVEYEINKK